MCNNKTLIRDMLIDVWKNRNIHAINKYFSDNMLYDSFIGKTINKKILQITIIKFFKAFSKNTISIDYIDQKNNIIYIKWHGYATNDGIFDQLQPSYKKIKFNVIGFYKIKHSLIVQATDMSNLKFNLIKSGSIPYFIKNNTTSLTKLLIEIKNIFNMQLSRQEILIISLWLTGYSNKISAKILNISPRTVEEYRRRIKYKLHITNKIELYDLIQHLEITEILTALSKKLSISLNNK